MKAARESGQPSLDGVMAVVLESNGKLGIIPRDKAQTKLLPGLQTSGEGREGVANRTRD